MAVLTQDVVVLVIEEKRYHKLESLERELERPLALEVEIESGRTFEVLADVYTRLVLVVVPSHRTTPVS
jgi:hypothetical protein